MKTASWGVVLTLAAASCSGSATTTTTTIAEPPPPSTSVVVTTSSPTTTTTSTTLPPTTTTVDPLARPDKLVSNFDRASVDDFDTTGENLWRVMLEIEDLFNYLEGNPQGTGEEMLGLTYASSYPDRDILLASFDELSENEWRYTDPGTEIVAIEVDQTQDNEAIVRLASRRGDQSIADSDGAVVKVYKGWDLDILTYQLLRGDDGLWRIADFIERLFPVPQDVLDAMVPVEWTGRAP